MRILAPGSVIGIIGGGQLGRMSAMAAARLGFHTHIFSAEEDCPARDCSTQLSIGPYDDNALLTRFAQEVDVVTFEFENISVEGLELLAQHCPVHPSKRILQISQDREQEKTFLEKNNFPIAQWYTISTLEDLHQAAEKLGYPFLLKTTRLGYDGKGQFRLTHPDDLAKAFDTLAPHPLVAEKLVHFSHEVSVMVARCENGQIVCFDTTENQHMNGILDLSLAPARISPLLCKEAQNITTRLAQTLGLIGIMGVEFFVGAQDELLINEIAPRPHNSGHWTMDACTIDQFEMHIRAVAGLPLPQPIRHADAVMKNLIGPEGMKMWQSALSVSTAATYLYGKKQAHHGRKMGHINFLYPFGSLPGDFAIHDRLADIIATE